MNEPEPLRPEDLPKDVERRQLSEHHVAHLLDNGCVVIVGDARGIETVLDAQTSYNLLDLLYTHRDLLHRLSQGQAGTHEQEPPQKLDPGLGTR